MKRKYLFMVIISFLVSMCVVTVGCNKTYKWQINGSRDEIEKIEIINFESDDDVYKNNYSLICEIEAKDFNDLINDIEKINYKKYFGDPKSPRGTVVKITFTNDNYDLISAIEPRHCNKIGGVLESKITWLSTSKESFDKLVEKWTT